MRIDLQQNRRFYHFILWILLFILAFSPTILKSQNENFDEFITEFALDSVFQINRISFPLLYISWDYEIDKEYSIFISKERYKYTRLHYSSDGCTDAYSVFYDNFDCMFRDTGEMVFRWRGFTDMDCRYYFERIKGKWFLIKILNYDPFE
jgi:hypothetical protein